MPRMPTISSPTNSAAHRQFFTWPSMLATLLPTSTGRLVTKHSTRMMLCGNSQRPGILYSPMCLSMLESGQLCAMVLLTHTLLIDYMYYNRISSLFFTTVTQQFIYQSSIILLLLFIMNYKTIIPVSQKQKSIFVLQKMKLHDPIQTIRKYIHVCCRFWGPKINFLF